jgi:uncharacterized protein (TIGR00297 family)
MSRGLLFGSLTRSGAIAAFVVGTLVFGFGGWRGGLLLVTFFATSSMLTRWHAQRKRHPEHRAGRSAGQVIANGLVASILAVWFAIAPSPEVLTAFAGAIAAATADTWATEVGLLSPSLPRLITTWRRVAHGTSGGVTLLGIAAGAVGASLIARLGQTLFGTSHDLVWIAAMGAMFIDSLLGATLEGRIPLFNNNAVNFLATLSGAALTALMMVRGQ